MAVAGQFRCKTPAQGLTPDSARIRLEKVLQDCICELAGLQIELGFQVGRPASRPLNHICDTQQSGLACWLGYEFGLLATSYGYRLGLLMQPAEQSRAQNRAKGRGKTQDRGRGSTGTGGQDSPPPNRKP